jgi:hypothetical protein
VSSEYRNNHYVPQWYQRRFIPNDQADQELFYLHLNPGTFTDSRGVSHKRRTLRRTGFRRCFAEDDLYTTRFGEVESHDIERVFFGDIDRRGKKAVEFFSGYAHTSIDESAFRDMLLYLSTQKLRTPKGLDWLTRSTRAADQQETLSGLIELRDLYSAIWMECVWQIADAEASETKFIVTDHPVTVYNRACGPRNPHWCKGSDDPDIRLHGTHTLFPLSRNRILILTNLSWARNPYQSPIRVRPNPQYFRAAMFNFLSIQVMRHLSEHEVREINFILKSRAYRYVGAAQEEWLYPERHVSRSQWNRFGDGRLLMPDPRPLTHGGEYVVGYDDGTTEALDVYGRRPEDPEFSRETNNRDDLAALGTFKAEFARRYGPYRRGRSCEGGRLDPERDSDTMHEHHLSLGRRRH